MYAYDASTPAAKSHRIDGLNRARVDETDASTRQIPTGGHAPSPAGELPRTHVGERDTEVGEGEPGEQASKEFVQGSLPSFRVL